MIARANIRRSASRWLSASLLPALILWTAGAPAQSGPIQIEKQGAFEAGGTVLGSGQSTLSCDHGYVEYQIPRHARDVALLMWHSSSTKVWQTRWDGGEGYQSIFLRRGFPVYLWDGPRVGRANWGCDHYTYEPSVGQDQQNFTAWRLGAKYPDFFPGVQFPTRDAEAWEQAVRARYQEFDTTPNAELEAAAAAKAIERVGPTVLVTNSAGGMRALLAAMKTSKVKAIVAYENPGYVFPSDVNPPSEPTRFGPVIVSPEDFEKLTRIPIQFVFGDNLDKSPTWTAYAKTSQKFVDLVNARGGKAEILFLPAAGLKGNTHIPFADLNNVAVADQLSAFLRRNRLDLRSKNRRSSEAPKP
ncbi:alpha/beta hydrolase [Rhizorhabdus dicambivorans]|uniref:alpha/beta hydrolase n=1 Tax=Rhizorhabdus dicambivorans TaxID=1850238 RepID=UPI0008368F31|nr:alpha/beta fold hydrolase [Rhizorhabdus dicambivorans]